jgi:hypothetical protein
MRINPVVSRLHSDSSVPGVDQGAVATARITAARIQRLRRVDSSRETINRSYVHLLLVRRVISGPLTPDLRGLALLRFPATIASPLVA